MKRIRPLAEVRRSRVAESTALLASALLAVACGSAGGGYWLYPGPRLDPSEEAVFISQEHHQVLSIDGEETAIRCFGEARGPRPYSQRAATCPLHIRPGEHVVVFSPGPNSRERLTVTFTAEPGRSYGLDFSACRVSVDQTRQRSCLVRVVEVGGG